MIFSIKNRNYCAVVVCANVFIDLPNCDAVRGCMLFGNHVIISKHVTPGTVGLFFPVETQLLPAFLGPNNLYRKAEYGNVDPASKGGFFEENGRVRCMKFRGHKSEGFFIPLTDVNGIDITELTLGLEFDTIGDLEICKKYVPRGNQASSGLGKGKQKGRQPKKEDLILDGQFRFHYETSQLKRNVHRVELDTPIIITDKWHGTSIVMAHLLTKRSLKWYERLLKKIGVRIQETEYGMIAASRRVIKSVAGEESADKNHFYDSDLWSLVTKENADRIPKGFTVYGEVVGYTPAGAYIQKGYDYRCAPNQHRLLVYRVTFTNYDGHVYELSWDQVKAFCQQRGLEHVIELWRGAPRELVADAVWWPDQFLDVLTGRYLENTCDYNNGVPAEGIVVRIDRLQESEAFKLKSFAFLAHETKALDEGAEDLELTEESQAMEESAT